MAGALSEINALVKSAAPYSTSWSGERRGGVTAEDAASDPRAAARWRLASMVGDMTADRTPSMPPQGQTVVHDKDMDEWDRAEVAEMENKAKYVEDHYEGENTHNPDGTVSTRWSGYVPPTHQSADAGSAPPPPTQQPVRSQRPVQSTTSQTPTAPKSQQSQPMQSSARQVSGGTRRQTWRDYSSQTPGMTPKPSSATTPARTKATGNVESSDSDIDSFISNARSQMSQALKRRTSTSASSRWTKMPTAKSSADTIMVDGRPLSRKAWLRSIDSRDGGNNTWTGARSKTLPTSYRSRTTASTARPTRTTSISRGIRTFNGGSSGGRRLGSG